MGREEQPPATDPGEEAALAAELVGRTADERLMEEERSALPGSAGEPASSPPWPVRRAVVGSGVALTGFSLVAGIVLLAIGIIDAVTSQAGSPLAISIIGLILIATHWGWVHVAEATATAVERRRAETLREQNVRWLATIEPYDRWEVATEAGEDGAITILTTRFRALPAGAGTFTFSREEVARDPHDPEEPAAAVSERAELARHRAAEWTRDARAAWEAARDAYELAELRRADEAERRAAARAAAAALSERINSHLSHPPLED